MSRIKVTFRQKQIILMLIENGNVPKTIKDISIELNVSSRTIVRELPFIEKFLFENDFKFIKKSGVGIFIDESYDKLNFLKELLENEYSVNKLSKNNRITYILESILGSNSPIKSAYFLNKFKISYSTFIKDLNSLKSILKKFDLLLIQKKGFGIYIKGTEEKIREILSYLIYEKFSDENLFLNIKNVLTYNYGNEGILKFIDEDTIELCDLIVNKAFDNFKLCFSEKVYVSLIIHLSLSVERIKKKLYCDFKEEVLNKFKKYFEFDVSKFIMNEVKKEFLVDINDSDICYIAMHLRAHKICENNFKDSEDFDFKNLDKIKIAGDIVSKVEKILNIYLGDCEGLIKNLSTHLGPAISRLVMKMNIRNPFLHMMKTQYKEIFDATYLACEVLENIVLCKVPESEVAYITMHIVAAYESKMRLKFKFRVLVCCETGVRVSRFLSNKIMKEFPNILVVGIIPSSKVIYEVKNKMVDFIISTVDIENYDNYIKINPKFTLKDILLINNKLEEIFKIKSKIKNTCYEKNKFIDIDCINEMGNIIKFIEKEFQVKRLHVNGDLKDLIREFVNNTVDVYRDEIYNEVLNRELLSSTFVKELGIILLHTVSEFSENIFIGSYFLKCNLNIYDGEVEIVFYFIIPKKLNTKTLRNIIGELTSSLVKDDNFINLIKSQNIYNVRKYIQNILFNYYVNELKEHIKNFENVISFEEEF